MANLLGENIGANYRGILNLDVTTINTPLDATLRAVTDGMGNISPLQLGTTSVSFGGSSGLYWDNANNRLGIGTIPASVLDIREANRTNVSNITNFGIYTTTAQSTDVGGTIGLGGLYNGSNYAAFGSIRGGKENSTSENYSGYLAFQTIVNNSSLTERMRITSNGNVGIGTTSPIAPLHVERNLDAHDPFPSLKRYLIIKNAPGYGAAQVGLTLTSLTTGASLNVWDIYNDSTATNTLRFAHGTSETGLGNVCMAITSTGNVGIATNPGNVRLVVKGNGTDPIMRLETLGGPAGLRLSSDGLYLNFGNSTNAAIGPAGTGGGPDIEGHGLRFYTNYGSQINAIGYNFCTVNGSISPTSGTSVTLGITESFTAPAGSANFRPLSITYTINNSGPQTGTASQKTATGIFLNATETNLNGMNHNLMDLQSTISGTTTSKFSVSSVGAVTANGDITISSTSGQLKISDTRIARGGADGTLVLLDSTGLNFNRLMFGGTGAGFPSIQRSGTNLSFKLADDSGFCSVTAANVFASSFFSTGSNIFHSTGAIYFLANTNARLNIFADGYSMEVNGRTAISSSALFTLNSTTKGFLPPRMTTTEINAIGTPAEGLVVFNTTISHLCVRQGGVWVRINHSPM